MSTSAMTAINELISTFDQNRDSSNEKGKIVVTKRVVKVEEFGDDYHDFDMKELLNNKDLMQQILMMEQDEKQQADDLIPIKQCYLPSPTELQSIRENLSELADIEILQQSSITNYERKFRIDKFEFCIQFMILPKSFIHCWLGFVASVNPQRAALPTMAALGGMGGIGGVQMGGPMSMAPSNESLMIKEHFLGNLMMSIPHRKPLSDEFGQTSMSSIPLIAGQDAMPEDSASNTNAMQAMNDSNFMLSANDLCMKLSKMLTRMSKCTVQISCDIPSQILNAPLQSRARYRMEMDDDLDDTNLCFQLEKTVLKIYNHLHTNTNRNQ